MKQPLLLSLAVLALGLSGTAPGATPPWALPSPAAISHPGATNAPASDPRTYPDEAGFQARAALILKGLAGTDLAVWRRGYFSGGDPGKYLPGHAMARLLLDPADTNAAAYMNDSRSCKEHYHFAAVNWARFLPLFGRVLTPDTRARLAEAASRYDAYLAPGGTENHRVMNWSSANVLPDYLEGGRLAHRDRAAALARAKELLKDYVKGLYQAGQGEWDSCTYLAFDLNGLLNIYDFSKDEECRLIAKAGLDWYAAAYALKYTDGVYAAPHQRGFAAGPHESIMDATGFLWWGSHAAVTTNETRDFRYTLAPLTSGWRPNAVLCRLARKELPRLPVEHRNTKPNYWHGLQKPPVPGAYHEVVYTAPHLTMGSLLNGHGSQITRFQIVTSGLRGGQVFTAGHPRRSDHEGTKVDFGYRDGIGRYDQIVQAGSTCVLMSQIPDGEPLDYAFFTFPAGSDRGETNGTFFFTAGDGFVAVTPVGGRAAFGVADLTASQTNDNAKAAAKGQPPKHVPARLLRNTGRRVAFVIRAADTSIYPDLAAFQKSAAACLTTPENGSNTLALTCGGLDGHRLAIRFNPADSGDDHAARLAHAEIDGAPLNLKKEQIYDGPYVRQEKGVLSVNDGREGFVIDFSGDRPVYRQWTAASPQL